MIHTRHQSMNRRIAIKCAIYERYAVHLKLYTADRVAYCSLECMDSFDWMWVTLSRMLFTSIHKQRLIGSIIIALRLFIPMDRYYLCTRAPFIANAFKPKTHDDMSINSQNGHKSCDFIGCPIWMRRADCRQ